MRRSGSRLVGERIARAYADHGMPCYFLAGVHPFSVRLNLRYDYPAAKGMLTIMTINDDFEFYEEFIDETELKAIIKDIKRALLVLLMRVLVIFVLWTFFVRPYLATNMFLLITASFVYIQLITFFYLLFAKRERRGSAKGVRGDG